uniref:Ribulose-phosphate 3-epimerase n=1 Tax=uncultured planctomycete 5H12 TaxID=455067 RepID=A9LGQ9_9BACT|nr:ribulose-phosphate 3-epimerase [uncultured planctomycete 5H12]
MSREKTLEILRESTPAILPSLLLCDFGNLEREIEKLHEAGFKSLHLDVMDGVFVPNFSYGITIVEAVRKLTDMPLDVHLMMVEPQKYVQQFASAGADLITFHAEAVDDTRPVLEAIRETGIAGGIALNPGTDVSMIENDLDLCDVFLVMSVNAGFGGQSFIESVLEKFSHIRNAPNGDRILLEIDGGINTDTIGQAHAMGVDLFVAGSAIFRQADYRAAHDRLLEQVGASNERV